MLTLEKAQEMVDTATEQPNSVKEAAITVVNHVSENNSGTVVTDFHTGSTPSVDGDLHSLAEVTRLLKISENRLRHWEKSFNQVLSNHRNQYNHRMFTEADVKILERIKFLQDSKLYTKEGIVARLNSKLRDKGGTGTVNAAEKQYQQKLLVALNTLATEIKGLRREVREDLRGDLKKELDHLTLLLFPPQKERKWYQIFKK
ncbi:MAG: MerR family transcriptional regulator [Patescibacteria group bacterium]|jgi:DNA-binding transcriptional MerR regulator